VGGQGALTGTASDLPTLQSLLEHGPYTDEPVAEMQALSIAFGDALADELEMEWVTADDDSIAFALCHRRYRVLVFPEDALLKRIEAGEQVDLSRLYAEIAEAVRQQLAQPGLAER
jgi:hypothetical protein